MRSTLTGKIVAMALMGGASGVLGFPGMAIAQQATREFSIPAQDLASAIELYSRQSGRQVMFDRASIIGARSTSVRGRLSSEQALTAMLKGTGLRFRAVNDRTVVIEGRAGGEAQGRPDGVRNASFVAPPAEGGDGAEIIVTARKREERLIDVPVPVTAVTSAALTDSNAYRVQDYYQRVPGLSLATSGNGNEPVIAIRGITTGGSTNPTVGIVVDDVPFGPSITTSVVPDIDPSSLSHIEVLRGPQGTLYGASSMGGLIKFVTTPPSTSKFSGSLQAGIAGVDRGGDAGYSLRGVVNVPVSDTLAIRASGFYRRDPGYVDNLRTGERDVNETRAKGLHASLLWAPSSDFSVRLSALVQNVRRKASDEIDLGLGRGRFAQNDLPFTGTYLQRARVYSAVIKGRVGGVDLTSITAYNYSYMYDRLDATPVADGLYAGLAEQFFGTASAYLPSFTRTRAITQEFRASIPFGKRVTWLIGGLIDREDILLGNQIDAFDTGNGRSIGSIVNSTIDQKYRNYALFSSVDWSLSDRFSLQVGGRWSTNRQKSVTRRSGALIEVLLGVPSVDSGALRSKESPFTFSITPQWKIRPDLMAYARIASGYRPGGPNINCGTPEVACTYGSDTTVNYELGVKGDLLDKLLTVDLSLYLIDWKDIQTLVITRSGTSGYVANGTKARSKGIELTAAIRLTRNFSIDGWIAYSDSVLTQDFPANARLFAFDGDRLPYSSRWSGNISVRQQFALSDRIDAFVGGNLSYVGNRKGTFQPTPSRTTLPSYWQFDLNAGLTMDDWRLNAFVTNVTNARGLLRSGADSNLPNLVTYIRPRSFGIALSKSF